MIFGVTSFLFLNRTVRKHTSNYNFDSDFVTKVVDLFFVDDFTGGEDTAERAYLLFKKLKLRSLEGRFNLTKWRTNDKELRELICDNDTAEKQRSKGVFIKRCSENMQQIYRRTSMPKCEDYGDSFAILLHIFRAPFPKSNSVGLLLTAIKPSKILGVRWDELENFERLRFYRSKPKCFC